MQHQSRQLCSLHTRTGVPQSMHNLLKEHTLTALSPKMSNFFISSATTMSWQERNGEAGVSTKQQVWLREEGRKGASLTVTPSASQYTCRGLLPSVKGPWRKVMAGERLSLSCKDKNDPVTRLGGHSTASGMGWVGRALKAHPHSVVMHPHTRAEAPA